MNNYQRQLIHILSKCIRGQEIAKIHFDDFQNVYEEAKPHRVHTLLYPMLRQTCTDNENDKKAIAAYKKEILISSLYESIQIKIIKEVLIKFNKAGIPVILLKGLILRELYPYPDLRTMCDIDIMIHKEDEEKVKRLLCEMNYVIDEVNPVHIQYVHKNNRSIEVHTSLINHEFVNGGASFEEDVWRNVVLYNFEGGTALVFSNEDQLLYLLLHMASHFVYSGFGLRQVCDLILLIEAIEKKINWKQFYDRVRYYGIDRFVSMILIFCIDLFNIEMPIEVNKDISDFEKYKSPFIDRIFSGGVYGRRDKVKEYSNRRIDRRCNKNIGKSEGRFTGIIQLILPPKESIASEYKYVKKCSFLLPVAVMHRLLFDRRVKNYKLHNKINLLIKVLMEIFRKYRMLHWLKLNP